jgi:hypothetical protein
MEVNDHGLIWGIIPEFAWKDWEQPQKPVRIVDAPAKIQAGYHPNTNVTSWANLLDTALLAIEETDGILTWSV